MLESRLADKQIDAALKLTEAMLFPDLMEEAKQLAREAAVVHMAIKLLESIRDGIDKEDEDNADVQYSVMKVSI